MGRKKGGGGTETWAVRLWSCQEEKRKERRSFLLLSVHNKVGEKKGEREKNALS